MGKKWETPSFDSESISNNFLGISKQEFDVLRDVLIDFGCFCDFYYTRFLGIFQNGKKPIFSIRTAFRMLLIDDLASIFAIRIVFVYAGNKIDEENALCGENISCFWQWTFKMLLVSQEMADYDEHGFKRCART